MQSSNSTATNLRNTIPANRIQSLRLHRLKNDLLEFRNQPYPGVEIFMQDESFENICLHLTPQSGALVGLRLHFDFELPEDWPESPPRVRCSFPDGLAHPNVFGEYICCDLLNVYADQTGFNGYTPAFTLRALCMQLLSFFSSSKIDQEYGGFYDIGDEFLTRYVEESKLWTFHPEYQRICSLLRGQYAPDQKFTDGKDFIERLLRARISRVYLNIEKDGAHSNSTPFKPGSWLGWKHCEPAQMEVEVTRIVSECKTPWKEKSARVRYRNPVWYRSYSIMRSWKGCTKCGYNQTGGSSLVDESLMITLKEAVKRLDGNQYVSEEDAELLEPKSTDLKLSSPKMCEISKLGNDLLLMIADHLSTESMNAFASVYPPFKAVIEEYHLQLYRDLQCFFLRKSLNSPAIHRDFGRTILGIGVGFYNRNFQSSFDWLSLEAFEVYNVRKGIDKQEFQHFLPLAFSAQHFQQAYPVIWQSINHIAENVKLQERTRNSQRNRHHQQRGRGRRGGFPATDSREICDPLPLHRQPSRATPGNIHVIYQFMNNIVVDLMRACDDFMESSASHNRHYSHQLLQASEKSIIAYCQLFYLLTCLAKVTPAIRQNAFDILDKFRLSPSQRTKDVVPDLGQLIVQLCLVNGTVDVNHPNPTFHKAFSWPKHMTGPFLQEVMIRNVRWVLKENPSLEIFERGASDYRLKETFTHSRTSIRLVMFQTFFLRFIVMNHQANPGQLEQNFGFPPEGVAETVVKEIKKIYAVSGWREYFAYIGYEKGLSWDKTFFCQRLKECVRESRNRGYHK